VKLDSDVIKDGGADDTELIPAVLLTGMVTQRKHKICAVDKTSL
jgi:hypothetical protein